MAPASSLGIFASVSSDTPGDGIQIGTITIPSLAGGATFSASATVSVPVGLPPAMYFLSAVADPPGTVAEENENNNGLTAPTFYVSPVGDDLNPGTLNQPFRTIEKARDTVRFPSASMSGDITVVLRGGEYVLPGTLEFTAADSGSNGFSVVYRASPGEKPVLTGGSTSRGGPQSGGIYKAAVPVGTGPFRQLYANGVRAIRARTPNAGAYNQVVAWDTGGSGSSSTRARSATGSGWIRWRW
jgi:hypothetical protein